MFTHLETFLAPAKPMPQRFLWLDLEMTGVNPEHDLILELAAVVGGYNLREDAVFRSLVHYTWDEAEPLVRGNDEFWVKHPQLEDYYQAHSGEGMPIEEVDQQLAEFIGVHFDTKAILAGNSIYVDRKWIDRDMPRTEELLDRRMLDVSSFKLAARGLYGVKFPKAEAHDPLDDIRESRQELIVLLSALRSTPQSL